MTCKCHDLCRGGALALILALTVTVAQPVSAASFIRGDSDANGAPEVTDPVRVFGFLFLGNPVELECHDAADDSGFLGISDGIDALNLLFTAGDGIDARGRRSPRSCGARRALATDRALRRLEARFAVELPAISAVGLSGPTRATGPTPENTVIDNTVRFRGECACLRRPVRLRGLASIESPRAWGACAVT